MASNRVLGMDRRRGARLPALQRLLAGEPVLRRVYEPAEEPAELAVRDADPAWSFPYGAAWRINRQHVAEWDAHRFEAWLTPAVLATLGAVADPLFLLRLDILTFERLFERFQRTGCVPATLADSRSPEALRHRYNALHVAEQDYLAGLVLYLRRGREEWGAARP